MYAPPIPLRRGQGDVILGLDFLLSSDTPEPDPVYDDLIRKIYDEAAGIIDPETVIYTANGFMQGVFEGFGKSFDTVAYNSPDYQLLAALEKNVFQFSGAKNYHMMQEMSLLLKDGDRLRSFYEFRREALKVVDEWVNNWGHTEYNTGIAASQSIAAWQRFEENKKFMPMLRFSGIHDAKECPICKAYDGITRPVDDPFWDYANVPLHFNDRCMLLQLADDQATPTETLPSKELIPPMFRVNQAKEQLVFPKGSPYFDGCPKEVLKKSTALISREPPETKTD